MLGNFREGAGRWVVGAILALLVLSFSLWGIGSYFQPQVNAAVAEVGDETIGQQELQRAVQAEHQRLRETLGERFRAELIDQDRLREQALALEINERMVQEDARRRRLALADTELGDLIRQTPAFQGEEGFDRQRYRDLLRARGLSVPEFEAQLRAGMLAEQLERGLTASAFATPVEIDELVRLWFETRDLVVATLTREAFADAASVDEAAIRAYYDLHPDEFRTPERVRVAYLLLDPAEVADEVDVSAEDVEAAYREAKPRYTIPAQRTVRHILVAVAADADEATQAQAREQAEALRARIADGEDFATLAREHSQDAGTARQGGLLGRYARGGLDPALDDTAFALEVGSVSDPVRSEFGYHLLRVDSADPERVRPLSEVREELIEQLRTQRAEEIVRARVEDLDRLSFEHSDSLKPAAEATGLPIRTTDFFARDGGQGPAAEPAFAAAAFAPEVLEQGHNSALVELEGGRYAVLRLRAHEPAATQPLAAVRGQIRERLRQQAAAERAREIGEALLEQLRGGTERNALSGDGARRLEWSTLAAVAREGRSGVAPEVLQRAFALPRPQDGTVHYAGVALPNGDYVLAGVTGVQTDPRAQDAESREQLREALVQLRRQAATEAYLTALRETIKVRVYPQRAE